MIAKFGFSFLEIFVAINPETKAPKAYPKMTMNFPKNGKVSI